MPINSLAFYDAKIAMPENSTMLVEKLPWDSNFFGFSVGQLVLPTGNVNAEDMKKAIHGADCELTYVFVPIENDVFCDAKELGTLLIGLGGRRCDIKVTYRKTLSSRTYLDQGVGIVATTVTPALEGLAYASGWCSRFVKDDRLSPFFKPMYRLWLEHDIRLGRVFVRPNEDSPAGMATVSVQDDIGKIGLVAVDAKFRGNGIATSLMSDIDNWLAGSQGVGTCEVVTQGENAVARRLYEKVGFKLFSKMEVWHVWRHANSER